MELETLNHIQRLLKEDTYDPKPHELLKDEVKLKFLHVV